MTEEKKLIVGLQGMRKRLISAASYLQQQGDKAGMDRCGRDCRLIEKAVNALDGEPRARLMPVDEVLENPETLIWLEHYRHIDNGPVLTPTAMYPNDTDDVDGYVSGCDEGTGADRPRIMDFYCGDIYQASDYGMKFRCWIGPMPSEVYRQSVPWEDQKPHKG